MSNHTESEPRWPTWLVELPTLASGQESPCDRGSQLAHAITDLSNLVRFLGAGSADLLASALTYPWDENELFEEWFFGDAEPPPGRDLVSDHAALFEHRRCLPKCFAGVTSTILRPLVLTQWRLAQVRPHREEQCLRPLVAAANAVSLSPSWYGLLNLNPVDWDELRSAVARVQELRSNLVGVLDELRLEQLWLDRSCEQEHIAANAGEPTLPFPEGGDQTTQVAGAEDRKFPPPPIARGRLDVPSTSQLLNDLRAASPNRTPDADRARQILVAVHRSKKTAPVASEIRRALEPGWHVGPDGIKHDLTALRKAGYLSGGSGDKGYALTQKAMDLLADKAA